MAKSMCGNYAPHNPPTPREAQLQSAVLKGFLIILLQVQVGLHTTQQKQPLTQGCPGEEEPDTSPLCRSFPHSLPAHPR
jgi:hypothetical protein